MAAAKKKSAKKKGSAPKRTPKAPKKARAKKSKKKQSPEEIINEVIEEVFPEEKFTHPGLDETACLAVEYIASGISFTDVARFVKIDRKTLYKWRKKAVFQEALELRLEDLDGDLRAEARVTARMARETLRAAFRRGSPQDAAVAARYLEKTGLLYKTDEAKETDKLVQEAASSMAALMAKHGLEPATN